MDRHRRIGGEKENLDACVLTADIPGQQLLQRRRARQRAGNRGQVRELRQREPARRGAVDHVGDIGRAGAREVVLRGRRAELLAVKDAQRQAAARALAHYAGQT